MTLSSIKICLCSNIASSLKMTTNTSSHVDLDSSRAMLNKTIKFFTRCSRDKNIQRSIIHHLSATALIMLYDSRSSSGDPISGIESIYRIGTKKCPQNKEGTSSQDKNFFGMIMHIFIDRKDKGLLMETALHYFEFLFQLRYSCFLVYILIVQCLDSFDHRSNKVSIFHRFISLSIGRDCLRENAFYFLCNHSDISSSRIFPGKSISTELCYFL